MCNYEFFKLAQIEELVAKLDTYYKEWVEQKTDKKTGDFKRYKDGTIKQRTIRPSLRELKIIQSNIKNRIFSADRIA